MRPLSQLLAHHMQKLLDAVALARGLRTPVLPTQNTSVATQRTSDSVYHLPPRVRRLLLLVRTCRGFRVCSVARLLLNSAVPRRDACLSGNVFPAEELHASAVKRRDPVFSGAG